MLASLGFSACQEEYEAEILLGSPLSLKSNEKNGTEFMLEVAKAKQNVLELSWTNGTNHGTGSAISYSVELDAAGNNFSKALKYNIGKAAFTKSITQGDLNKIIIERWKGTPGKSFSFEVRVTGDVADEKADDNFSEVLEYKAVPYKPLTNTLYLIGSASSTGWDNSRSMPLTADSDNPTIFRYTGAMKAGEFKFITTLGQYMPSYNKAADAEGKLFLRENESQPDNKFKISEDGIYKLELDLVKMSISVEKQAGAPYEALYLVGDATSADWAIDKAVEVARSTSNPYQFVYRGFMKKGEFKYAVNRNTDWQQDMFMRNPEDDSKVIFHEGGSKGDTKWNIEKEGTYRITLDLSDYTIKTEFLSKHELSDYDVLYIVGDATSVEWSVTEAIEMKYDPENPFQFIYEGPLKKGEFKFPVNRNGDWQQDMFMKDPKNPSKVYLHKGGQSDDSKWNIETAGEYKIVLDVKKMEIAINKK
ncbi:MAG: SusF/SusE family outer membrane protein [Cytophagales bacterium]|nr:SusF/SusE family outer membrane protein [Cytophagales bacterium]